MFGIDVFDASLLPALFVALMAGIVSFLSPCVLPIVPPYLAYMAGTNIKAEGAGRRSVIAAALFFVLGLSTVFLFLGFTASFLGQMFMQYQREFSIVAGVMIIVFGLHFLGILRIPLLYREARIDAGDRSGSIFGAYVLGLAFAFGWTPCIGPILGAIISLAAQETSVGRGVALMASYAVGLGVPFLLAAIFLDRFMSAMTRFRQHMGKVEKAMGLMLLIVGLMMAFGVFTWISNWLLDTFPGLTTLG
ncbi:cytochrome c biogenesis CcdA family protein [Halovulum sp. GXIMD14793]